MANNQNIMLQNRDHSMPFRTAAPMGMQQIIGQQPMVMIQPQQQHPLILQQDYRLSTIPQYQYAQQMQQSSYPAPGTYPAMMRQNVPHSQQQQQTTSVAIPQNMQQLQSQVQPGAAIYGMQKQFVPGLQHQQQTIGYSGQPSINYVPANAPPAAAANQQYSGHHQNRGHYQNVIGTMQTAVTKPGMQQTSHEQFVASMLPNGPHQAAMPTSIPPQAYSQSTNITATGSSALPTGAHIHGPTLLQQHPRQHGHQQISNMPPINLSGSVGQNAQAGLGVGTTVPMASSSSLRTNLVTISVANVMDQSTSGSSAPMLQQPITASGSIQANIANLPAQGTLPMDPTNGLAQPSGTFVGPGHLEARNSMLAGDVSGVAPTNKARYGNSPLFIPIAATVQPLVNAVAEQVAATPGMEVQTLPQLAAHSLTRRERKPLQIVNPDTQEVVDTDSIERERKERESKPDSDTSSSESHQIVITDPKTNMIVSVGGRTPHVSISESSSKLVLPHHSEASSISVAAKPTLTNMHNELHNENLPPQTLSSSKATKQDERPESLEKETARMSETAQPSKVFDEVVAARAMPATEQAAPTPGDAKTAVDDLAREEQEKVTTIETSVSESAPGTETPVASATTQQMAVSEIVVEKSSTGRWNYDRDTLLKLKANGSPLKLGPEFHIIVHKATAQKVYGRQSFTGQRPNEIVVPDFVWSPMMQNMMPGGVSRGGSFQAPRGKKQPIVIEPLPTASVKLHHAESAYVPSFVKSDAVAEDEHEKLRRKLLSILNKITPQKFRQLMIRTFDLISAANTPELLESVVSLIFEKAISEPNFSVAYSHVCRHLMDTSVPSATNPDKPITFKFLLITKCQKEFEKKGGDTPLLEQIKRRQQEINEEKSEDRKAQLRAEMDDITGKARRRALGNTKFIGELFKLEILTDTIVYFCLQHYLKEADDDSLECLCKLLITIGMKLDSNQKFKDRFNDIFCRIKKIVDEKSCSLRLRCLLQDVLDLRVNEWKPRREEGGPKTIDQIHADAQREETERAIYSQFAQFPAPRSGGNVPPTGEYQQQYNDVSSRASNRRDRGGRDDGSASSQFSIPANVSATTKLQGGTSGGVADSDSEMQMSYRRGGKLSNAPAALEPATTIKLPTATVNAGEVRLGPGAPRKAWGAGAQQAQPAPTIVPGKDPRLGGKQPQQLAMTKQGSGGAWRLNSGASDTQRSDLPTSRTGPGALPDKWGPERSGPPASLASRVANREQDTPTTAHSGASSSEASRDATPDRRPSLSVVVQQVGAQRNSDAFLIGSGPRIDDEVLAQGALRLFNEYFESGHRFQGPAVTEVEETSRAENFDVFITALVNESFEQRGTEHDDSNARRTCGRLLAEMFSKNLLNQDIFIKGLRSVTREALDLEIDLPRVYDYLAELLCETVRGTNDYSLLRCIAEILEPIRAANKEKSSGVAVSIFKQLEKRLGKEVTEKLWRSSGLQWSSFIDEDRIAEMLNAQHLSYLLGESQWLPGQLTTNLKQLLDSGKSNEEVIEWIDANVQCKIEASEQQYGIFVRALVTAVTNASLNRTKSISDASTVHVSLNPDVFSSRCSVLHRYIDHKPAREAHALCALQLWDNDNDHPSGILCDLFYKLFDNEVISDEAFRLWHGGQNEPHEKVGFGVAKTAVTKFYTYLNEAEGDED